MAGDADLHLWAEDFAGLPRIAIALPQMHTVGAEPLRQRDAVVDDEGDVAIGAERLRSAVEAKPIVCPGFEGVVTVSLGVATLSEGMERVDDLIGAADQAVYRAKELGRNRVFVWEPPGRSAQSA